MNEEKDVLVKYQGEIWKLIKTSTDFNPFDEDYFSIQFEIERTQGDEVITAWTHHLGLEFLDTRQETSIYKQSYWIAKIKRDLYIEEKLAALETISE